jgi:GAF domain-containing protein
MLEQMRQRLHATRSFEEAVETILEDVIALHGAEFGNVQLVSKDHLVIAAQRNFARPFLNTFRRVHPVDGSACGRALKSGKAVLIADVDGDAEYAPVSAIAREAGYRAVQTTPLFTAGGRLIGMVSTHFANVHTPTPIEMETLAIYSRVAADYLNSLLGKTLLVDKAEDMSARLYAHAPRPAAASGEVVTERE